jgi:hypothetical protein
MDLTSLFQSLVTPATSAIEDKVTSALPTKQEAVQGYLGAVVAFWVVGGITLYIVNRLSK